MTLRTQNHAWEVATVIVLLVIALYLILRGRAQAAGQPFPGLPGIDYPAIQYVVPGPPAGPTLNVSTSPFNITSDPTGGVDSSCNCPGGGAPLAFGTTGDQAAWLYNNGANFSLTT
jgi:hypothetical protein